MTTKSRFTTAIATGAVLLNALAPIAFASSANDITVTGNGVNSTSNVSVNRASDTVVNQTNNANITNNVSSNASSGGNSSSFNTGGATRIVTGNATSNVKIDNAANLNKADLSNCNCNGGAYNVTVDGNGVGSDNNVNLNKANQTFLNQDNNANIKNDVDAKAKTGDNDASYNTGGDTKIVTGNAGTLTLVNNTANANFATIGGGNGNGNGGSSVKISGNGAWSDSDVNLNDASAIVLDQSNNARIRNDIDAKASTGNNDESFNTGGENKIKTGDAWTGVGVDNAVNFNAANVDCDCVLSDADVKVAGNGVGSDSNVDVDAANDLFNTQDNYAGLYNNVDGKAKTGYNDVEFSTGPTNGDPSINTGNSDSNSQVSSNGNVNLFNNGSSIHIPGNWDMNVGFDFSDLWSMFAGL
jgi:hypothetical protein